MKLFTLAKSEKLVFKLGQACSVCVLFTEQKQRSTESSHYHYLTFQMIYLEKTTRSDLLVVLDEMVIDGNTFSNYLS